ncbi:MAG: hypothetical protein COY58_02315 [Gammaproteobacteria bacterium CG_4_10_14_0_8_um_filter_38_16]|nr:MAG: hypothetical protein COY58_02315 [Gammaproteobacteria bacterium CG_4_10_14_0_8_um_filter_38_16]PJA03769.1 MAG: hypothetical protein COX72_02475 [Gammaproteobacteria bacterium CG_4_10_14_0_2_um_filter_38_22]
MSASIKNKVASWSDSIQVKFTNPSAPSASPKAHTFSNTGRSFSVGLRYFLITLGPNEYDRYSNASAISKKISFLLRKRPPEEINVPSIFF